MKLHTWRTVSTRAATVVGAVVITAVVVAGSLDLAQAATEAVANNSVNSAKIIDNSIQTVDIKDGTIEAVDLAAYLRPRFAKVATGVGSATHFIRQRGATALSRSAMGEYDVTFNTDITHCGWIATRNDDGSGGVGPGEIGVERASDMDTHRLRVRIYNSAGTQADPESDDGFTLMVLC